MSEPLYSVGQKVAVASLQAMLYIPCTTVLDYQFVRKGELRVNQKTGEQGRQAFDKHTYRVVGVDGWVWEAFLRPIQGDTEYKDQPESVEQPA